MLNFIKRHKRKIGLVSIVVVLLGIFFSRPLTYLALDFYDVCITPHNGECAYKVLYGKHSCSEYFRDIVDKKGVFSAIKAMPEQFHKCNLAFHELERRSEGETMPACCFATVCCADIITFPVPVGHNPISNTQCQAQVKSDLQKVSKK